MLIYSNRTRIMEPAPPIGLSYVASATRRAGHEVRFVDLMVSPDPVAELTRATREFQPDVAGFSIRNIDNIIAQRVAWHITDVGALISVVRKHSRATVVLGGPATSILGQVMLEHLDADFAVVGEGEITFPKLLAALATNSPPAGIPGLCYRTPQGVVAYAPIREPAFGDSGMEDWIKWKPYERAGGTWAIHTKRGCPLSCLYCNYPVMEGHQQRSRTAVDVVDEMERVIERIGPRTFEFTDSTFNIPETHAANICREIIRRNLRVKLSAVSINPMGFSQELLDLMKQAGFCSLVITPDSASNTMLKALRKGFGVDQVRRVAEIARASGIPCTWFFLLGGPGETRETVEETVSFVETHLDSKRFLSIFLTGIRLLPGTPLTQQALAENFIQAGQDLCKPVFYFSPQLNESWVIARINQAIAKCPTIVHGAEQNGSWLERAFNRALYWSGAAPPYYRFLPWFLRTPPLPYLRAKHTGVKPATT